jgi:hypothetical protein
MKTLTIGFVLGGSQGCSSAQGSHVSASTHCTHFVRAVCHGLSGYRGRQLSAPSTSADEARAVHRVIRFFRRPLTSITAPTGLMMTRVEIGALLPSASNEV